MFHDVSKESYRLHLRGNHSPSDVASHPRKKGKTGIQSLLFAVGVEANSLAHRYQKPTQQNTSAEHTVLSVYKFSRAKFLHTWNTHARSHTHSVCGLRSHNRIMGPRWANPIHIKFILRFLYLSCFAQSGPILFSPLPMRQGTTKSTVKV